jgi:hypothetical protein
MPIGAQLLMPITIGISRVGRTSPNGVVRPTRSDDDTVSCNCVPVIRRAVSGLRRGRRDSHCRTRVREYARQRDADNGSFRAEQSPRPCPTVSQTRVGPCRPAAGRGWTRHSHRRRDRRERRRSGGANEDASHVFRRRRPGTGGPEAAPTVAVTARSSGSRRRRRRWSTGRSRRRSVRASRLRTSRRCRRVHRRSRSRCRQFARRRSRRPPERPLR